MDQDEQLRALAAELVASQDQFLALLELANELRQSVRPEEAMAIIAASAARLTGADAVAVEVELPGRGRLCARYPEEKLDPDHQQRDQDGEGCGPAPMARGVQTLTWPIECDQNVSGTLSVAFSSPQVVGSPVRKVIEMIVAQAGTTLDSILLQERRLANARLQTELQLAHQVQTSLMPEEPRDIRDLEIAAASIPAREVGGDFYAYGHGPDGAWQVLVGDVAGKGMPAALLMAMIQTTYRNTRHLRQALNPGEAIDFLNATLYDDISRAWLFATAICAQYDAADQALRYANAGHAPVILKPFNLPSRLLPAPDVPIGVLPELCSRPMTVPFGGQDILLIGSDGLTDAVSPEGELFGLERLLSLLDSLAMKPAAEIRDGIMAAIAAFSNGQEQTDDQTVIVVKRSAS